MALTGKFMNAQEAFRLGLVDKIVPANDPLVEEAKRIAKTIIGNAPLALEAGKRAINRGIEMSLGEGLVCEAALVSHLILTAGPGGSSAGFCGETGSAFQGQMTAAHIVVTQLRIFIFCH
jgi:enoyl-CoA hydratase